MADLETAHATLDHDGLTGVTSNPMTTQDDLIVGGASGVPGRLGKGSDGQILTVDPTTHHLVWANNSGVADIVDLTTAETDDTLVLAPDGAGGVEWRAETGGGGGAVPIAPELVKKYTQNASNTNSAALTLTAHNSGHRMIVVIASYSRDVNTPTCTNVTFTEVLGTNFSTGAYLSIYVGVIAGGSSGTTLTITAATSNWIVTDVYIVSDTLTPTAGTSATLTNTDASSQAGVAIGPITPAIGSFYIIGSAQNDGTTGFSSMTVNAADPIAVKITPSGANSALSSAIGRTCAASVYGYTTGGSSGGDFAAGIVVVT